jgi:hypothetical protein
VAQDDDLPDEPESEEVDEPAESLASVVLAERSEDVAGICGRLDATPTWAVVILSLIHI